MEVTLKDIFIGKANGLEEAESDKFEDLFYKGNLKYQQLVEDRDKFIISGRKGTGKTILAKYFEKEMNKQNILVKMLTDREVILKCFLEKGSTKLDKQEAELFIEYTILCELANTLLDNKKKFFRFKNIIHSYFIVKKIRELETLVRERFEAQNFVKDNFSHSQQRKSSIGSKAGESDNFAGSISADYEFINQVNAAYIKSPYYHLLEKMRKNIFYLLKIVPVNIIFDDLDEFDDIIDGNKDFIKFLNVFIQKAQEINVCLRKNKISNSRIIILLRSDIIKVLNSESKNLNKIIADSEIRLNWIKKVDKEQLHPLMDLIATKIKKSNKLLDSLSNREIVKRFFSDKVNGVPVMDHMLNCSFGRPRDIINMLNIIRENYPDAKQFTSEEFKRTQLEYSNKFTDELRNEMAAHFESEKTKECFDIIKCIGEKTFWISQVTAIFEEHGANYKFFSNEKEFIDLAYEFGIIGNTWPNDNPNSDRKYNFSWKYREDGFDIPDYGRKFYVHLALRKCLLP